jgi:hypothetical protein
MSPRAILDVDKIFDATKTTTPIPSIVQPVTILSVPRMPGCRSYVHQPAEANVIPLPPCHAIIANVPQLFIEELCALFPYSAMMCDFLNYGHTKCYDVKAISSAPMSVIFMFAIPNTMHCNRLNFNPIPCQSKQFTKLLKK